MATSIQDVIKRFIYRYQVEGADKFTSANQAVAATTQQTDRAALSLEKSFSNLERRFNSTIRAQQDLEKVQKRINDAVAQNPALQARANALMALVTQHYATAAQRGNAYAAVTDQINAKALAATGALGSMGGVLAGLGPIGLTVGASLGVVSLGIATMVKQANELGAAAGKMTDFADTTGLTTTQLQALQKAGAMVGVEADKIGTSFERFSVSLEELRRGTGNLYEGLNRVNPSLTRQLAITQSAGEAWDVLSRAIANATSQEQRNAIARAAFGRSGIPLTRLATETTSAGGLAGLETSLGQINTLTDAQLRHWDELKDKIDYTTKLAKQNVASIFTTQVLESQLQFTENWLKFSQSAKDFTLSGDWGKFIADLTPSGDIGRFIPIMSGFISAMQLAQRVAGRAPEASGGVGWDYAGFEGLGGGSVSLPMPRSRPAQADPRFDAANLQKQIQAMGEAADSADKLRLAEMQLAIAAKEVGLSHEQYAKALGMLREQDSINDMRERLQVMGDSATVIELMEYRVKQLNMALAQGKISHDDYFQRMGDIQENEALRSERARVSALGDAATATDRYAVRVMELRKQLKGGIIDQETFNKAVANANPIFQELKGAAQDFTTDFVRGMMQGKSVMEALGAAATNLSSKLAEGAIADLFSGNFISAGIKGVAAAGAYLFGKSQEEEKKKQSQYEQNLSDGFRILLKEAMLGVDTSTMAGEFEALEIQYQQKRLQAQITGQGASWMAEREYQADRAALTEEWAKRTRAIMEALDDRRFAATNDLSTLEGQRAAMERSHARELLEISQLGQEAELAARETHRLELLRLDQEWNDRDIEERRRAQEELTQIGRGITSYLLGLSTNSQSPLSPSARLSAARQAYEANQLLAMSGNADAQGQWTQLAEAYRQAGRSYYGSGSGYQAIHSQIISEGGALPAVAQTTDPIVAALNAVAQSINANTTTVGTSVTGVGTAVTGNTTTIGNSVNGVWGAVANVGTSVSGVGSSVSAVGTSVSAVGTAVTNVGSAVTSVGSTVSSAGTAITNVGTAVTGVGTTVTNAGTAIVNVGTAVTSVGTTVTNAGNAIANVGTAVTNMGGPLTSIGTTLTTAGTQIAGVGTAVTNVGNTVTTAGTQIAGVGTAVTGVGTTVTNAGTAIVNVGTAVTNVGATVTSAGSAITNVGTQVSGVGTAVTNTGAAITSVGNAVTGVNNSLGTNNGTLNDIETGITGSNGTNAILGELKTLNQTLTQQFAGNNVGIGASSSTQNILRWNSAGNFPYYETVTTNGGVISDNQRFINGTDPILASLPSANRTTINTNQGNIAVPTAVDNSMLAALNKIVWNTYAIAFNTAKTQFQSPHLYGVYAEGGVIPPHGLGLVSEHSPGGGRFIRAGNEPITVSPFAPMAANDNWALLAELQRLTTKVSRLEDVCSLLTRIAHLEEQGNDKIDRNTEATLDAASIVVREDRLNKRRRAA